MKLYLKSILLSASVALPLAASARSISSSSAAAGASKTNHMTSSSINYTSNTVEITPKDTNAQKSNSSYTSTELSASSFYKLPGNLSWMLSGTHKLDQQSTFTPAISYSVTDSFSVGFEAGVDISAAPTTKDTYTNAISATFKAATFEIGAAYQRDVTSDKDPASKTHELAMHTKIPVSNIVITAELRDKMRLDSKELKSHTLDGLIKGSYKINSSLGTTAKYAYQDSSYASSEHKNVSTAAANKLAVNVSYKFSNGVVVSPQIQYSLTSGSNGTGNYKKTSLASELGVAYAL